MKLSLGQLAGCLVLTALFASALLVWWHFPPSQTRHAGKVSAAVVTQQSRFTSAEEAKAAMPNAEYDYNSVNFESADLVVIPAEESEQVRVHERFSGRILIVENLYVSSVPDDVGEEIVDPAQSILVSKTASVTSGGTTFLVIIDVIAGTIAVIAGFGLAAGAMWVISKSQTDDDEVENEDVDSADVDSAHEPQIEASAH